MTGPVFTHGDWVQVYVDRDSDDDGDGYARIVEKHGRTGVVILLLRGDTVALVDVYRPALGRLATGVPRGFGETHDPVEDARREVAEETGICLTSDELIDLGRLHANDGLLANDVALFAAHVADVLVTGPQEHSEVRHVRWIPVPDLLGHLAQGEITDAFTHSVVLRALLRGLLAGYAVSAR